MLVGGGVAGRAQLALSEPDHESDPGGRCEPSIVARTSVRSARSSLVVSAPSPCRQLVLTRKSGGPSMQTLHQRVAGLDVHKMSIMACVRVTDPRGQVEETVRTFGTMTEDLQALSA